MSPPVARSDSRCHRKYRTSYQNYLDRNSAQSETVSTRFDSAPRVILMPGLGGACSGKDVCAANVCRDITAQTLEVKARIGAMGNYESLSESDLFAMEYHTLQHKKLEGSDFFEPAGGGGDRGCRRHRFGLSRVFLEQGCHVAVTDLPARGWMIW